MGINRLGFVSDEYVLRIGLQRRLTDDGVPLCLTPTKSQVCCQKASMWSMLHWCSWG